MHGSFKKYLQNIILFIATIILHTRGVTQPPPPDYARLLKVPKQYTILKTTGKIRVDGKDNENEWSQAPWTEYFTDIKTGANADENSKARCKMLWDSNYLYVYAEFQEQDIWASIKQQDYSIFHDNALEIFINPDGSTFNYFEFQINAYEAVWDLFFSKPYRSGGYGLSSWDFKGLLKAVHIAGTLNNPSDRDSSWSIELAIPFASLDSRNNSIKAGTIWRMNFSRVQWQLESGNGVYARKKDNATGRFFPERYYVWSPQGIVNLHYPERWGYALFADTLSPGGFLNYETEKLKLSLWKYYYLQQQYNRKNGRYAATLAQLDKLAEGMPDTKIPGENIQMFVNEKQFWIQGKSPSLNSYIAVDQEGELHTDTGKLSWKKTGVNE